mmetsp:Transcript_7793/g.13742  ORF Transcript_7793/g.13742 Transcript_7793/m.13742 type:complete len:210 (+) Transcript_7793:1100-1729(+)
MMQTSPRLTSSTKNPHLAAASSMLTDLRTLRMTTNLNLMPAKRTLGWLWTTTLGLEETTMAGGVMMMTWDSKTLARFPRRKTSPLMTLVARLTLECSCALLLVRTRLRFGFRILRSQRITQLQEASKPHCNCSTVKSVLRTMHLSRHPCSIPIWVQEQCFLVSLVLRLTYCCCSAVKAPYPTPACHSRHLQTQRVWPSATSRQGSSRRP